MKKLILSSIFFISFISFISLNSWSQQYFFKNYSVKQGLPQSSVYCMIQDSLDYIWVGTDGSGVCRFDGRDFQVFNKTNGLSGNIVRSLFRDSKNNIWIGTDKGVTIYDGFKFSQIGEKEELTESTVLAITEDTSGIIWIGTNDKGLYRVENKDSLLITRFTATSGLVSNFIFDIQIDNYGRIWLAMVGGVNVIEYINGKPKINRSIRELDVPEIWAFSAEKDLDGNLWFGTNGNGIFKVNVAQNLISTKVERYSSKNIPGNASVWDIKWTSKTECWIATNDHGVFKLENNSVSDNFTKENGLLINQILKILEDKEGNMWFASLGNGLLQFENKRFVNYNSKSSKSIKSNQIFNIITEGQNTIYTGTDEGLYQFQQKGDQFFLTNHFNALKGLPDNNVNALIKDKNGIIWIGTNNGLVSLKNGIISRHPLNNEFSSMRIHCLLYDNRNNIWVGTDNGLNRTEGKGVFTLNEENGLVNNEVQTIVEDKNGNVWLGTLGGLVKIRGIAYTDYDEKDGFQGKTGIYSLAVDETGNIWIGTAGGGIYKFDIQKDSIPISIVATKGLISSNEIYSLEFISDTILIAGEDLGFDEINLDQNFNIKKVIHYGLDDGFTAGKVNINSFTHDEGGVCWFGTPEGLIRFNPGIKNKFDIIPKTMVTGIKLFFEDVEWIKRGNMAKWFNLPDKLVLPNNENHLTFKFSGIYFKDPQGLQYSYFLEGQSKAWSPYTYYSKLEFQFPGLSPGNYNFLVKSRNKFGVEGQTAKFGFIIKPPFWQTAWFISSAIIILIFAVYTGVRLRLRNLQMEKIRLEKIVEERTREVVEQKNEIERQRDIVIWQKQEITDSINYAKKIQSAVLPDHQIIKEYFPDYFVLFKPKDIVSGDFYWVNRKDDHILFIAADCTGHGVPGAFMSMLGVSFLNEIVNQTGIVQPDQILNKLRANVLSAFRQHKVSAEETKDGMDIAACSYDIKNKKLNYAGANNPIYLVRKVGDEYQLTETPADKQPVAYYINMTDFTNHEIDIQPGDTVYIFSDGFRDQFGGPSGKKFMKKNFQNMFLENQKLSMFEQQCIYDKVFHDWIHFADSEEHHIGQIDDILVMGVRF